MQDAPTPDEILETVAKLMRETLMPELSGRPAYLARVAANALDLVRRQIQLEPAADSTERERLTALLGKEGSLADLNRALCEAIESHAVGSGTPGLAEHLWATAVEKVAVDQPNYAAYKRAIHKD
jgi:hypothetical protein